MDEKQRNPGGQSSWRIRRRFMFAVTAFCMWVIAYVLWKGLTTGPAASCPSGRSALPYCQHKGEIAMDRPQI